METARVSAKALIVIAAMSIITLAQMMALIGSGILAQTMTSFLGDSSVASWLSSILSIFGFAMNIPVSQAADYWGRKWLIVIPSAISVAGLVVISRANSIAALISGFSIIGPSFGSQSLFYAVASEILPRKHRATAQAVLGASTGLAGVFANLAAGFLLRDGTQKNYRIYWYIVAGVYAVGTVGVLIGYNPPKRELEDSLTFRQKLRHLDWVGYVLITSGLALFSIGLQWSGNPYSWGNAHVLAPFILGVVILVILVIYEWRFRADGLFHHALFGDRNFAMATTCMLLEGLSFFTTNSYFTWEVSLLYHLDFLQGCTRYIMMYITGLVVSPLAGLYSTSRKSVRSVLVIGFIALLVWNILMVTVKRSTPSNALWGYPILAGIGFSCIIQNAVVATQLSTPSDMISVATGITMSARGVGGTIALAVNNAIFKDGLDQNLTSKVAAALSSFGFPLDGLGRVIEALSSGDPEAISQALGGDRQLIGAASAAYTDAYTIAFRNAWISASCFSFVGLVVSCLLRNPRSEFVGKIDAPMEKRYPDMTVDTKGVEAGATHHETANDHTKPVATQSLAAM